MESLAHFSFAITAAVTIAGWFIVARQTERREFRKEVRDRIADLGEACSSVHRFAADYWISSTPKEAPAAAVALQAEIKRLSRITIVLNGAGLDFDQPKLVSEIRIVATSGDFAKKGRRHNAGDADVVADTVGALEDLLLAVDDAFYSEFRPVRPSTKWRWIPVIGALLALRE